MISGRFSYDGLALYQAAYMTGKMISVKTVATKSPPAIATAMGPQKTLETKGSMPRIAAAAVSMMGRKRLTVALMITSHNGSFPWFTLLFMKKEDIQRYISVAMFGALITTIIVEIALALNWRVVKDTAFPFYHIPPFTYGAFPVGIMWSFRRNQTTIITNISLPAIFFGLPFKNHLTVLLYFFSQ
jgi:hypothetical protein